MNSGRDSTDDTGCPKHVGQQQQGIDRRTILRAGAAGSVMVVVLPFACGPGGGSPPSGPILAGKISDITVGTLKVINNAVLARDSGGLYAMSSICTHQGCAVLASGAATAGLNCPCHGSAFDQNGAVTHGPAPSPLEHYQVDLASNGAITIRGEITVASTTRTPVG